MARAGFVFRFLEPCAVAVLLGFISACGGGGGDGGEPVRTVTTVTVTSPTVTPKQGDTVQLNAVARDQFGDVIPGKAATWSTSDARVATISQSGLLQAVAPGAVVATATIDAVPGSLTLTVVPGTVALRAAYFIDGVEYAFDYQLDAQGRVDNFRISRREDIAYPTPPDSDGRLIECTGSLHGRYDCSSTAPAAFLNPLRMQGEMGVAMSFVDFNGVAAQNPYVMMARYSYAYGPAGLASVAWQWQGASVHWTANGSETLNYDAGGRLASLNETSIFCYYLCQGATASIPIVVDSTGRLLGAERTPVAMPPYENVPPGMTRSVTTWTYDSRGYMERMDVAELDGLGVARATSTRYAADADGWLTSRIVHSEDRAGVVTETVDRYSILRSGGYVEEESFTQAEPSGFYQQRAPQRVRYDANRRPTEPLFVPRALTGLKGADYFGIISSHDR